MGAKRLTIRISGLRCAGSECYTLERALRREPGVVDKRCTAHPSGLVKKGHMPNPREADARRPLTP